MWEVVLGRLGAATGSGRLGLLVALRDRLAADIDVCESARDVAALSARLMACLAEIDELESLVVVEDESGERSPLSELETRLRERETGGTAAAGKGGAGRKRNVG